MSLRTAGSATVADSSAGAVSRKHERVLMVIAVLAVPGIAFSSYLTFHHYDPRPGLCNINEVWNCDAVNRSGYSEIFGIPVALLGLLMFVAFLVLALAGLGIIDLGWLNSPLLMIGFAAVGSASSVYLTYVEVFILRTMCPFCVICAALTWAILLLSLILRS